MPRRGVSSQPYLESLGVFIVDRHNAFSIKMVHSLVFVYELAHHDNRVKVVILIGTGIFFCAGADLSTDGFGVKPGAPPSDDCYGGGQVVLTMLNYSKPIITAVNGNAAGIGLTMNLPTDLRICAQSAKLTTPFVKRGIPCDALSSYLLPHLVGYSNASKVSLAGELFLPSSSALSYLFYGIKPPQDVLPTALALAEHLSREDLALSTALIKLQIWRPDGAIKVQRTGGIEEMHERQSTALAWAQPLPGMSRKGFGLSLKSGHPTSASVPEN